MVPQHVHAPPYAGRGVQVEWLADAIKRASTNFVRRVISDLSSTRMASSNGVIQIYRNKIGIQQRQLQEQACTIKQMKAIFPELQRVVHQRDALLTLNRKLNIEVQQLSAERHFLMSDQNRSLSVTPRRAGTSPSSSTHHIANSSPLLDLSSPERHAGTSPSSLTHHSASSAERSPLVDLLSPGHSSSSPWSSTLDSSQSSCETEAFSIGHVEEETR